MGLPKNAVNVIYGGGLVASGAPISDQETLRASLDVLKEEGIRRIDTAQGYGNSEEMLGEANAGVDFVFDTKVVGGFSPGSATKANIIKDADESLRRLKVDKIEIFYIHAPDYETPISDTLEGINEVFKAGKFARFGLSNYKPEDVERVYEHCKNNGYPLPTAYQGNYSAVARRYESTLFPILRKLGISFFAYATMAGGFLSKTKEEIISGAGRFNDSEAGGTLYMKLYKKPAYLDTLAEWEDIAYNSHLRHDLGDGIVVGARNAEQLQQTLDGLKAGPLNDDVCRRIEAVWKRVESEAPVDNFHV
jgi:aflatoxin B1 aldehyde reductase